MEFEASRSGSLMGDLDAMMVGQGLKVDDLQDVEVDDDPEVLPIGGGPTLLEETENQGSHTVLNSENNLTGMQIAIVSRTESPVSPLPKRDPKRSKTSADGKDTTSSTKTPMAGSCEGRRRGQ